MTTYTIYTMASKKTVTTNSKPEADLVYAQLLAHATKPSEYPRFHAVRIAR